MVLSDAVIKLQQELSDKFGLVTFDLTGGISTVPASGIIKVDTGLGKFTGETQRSLTGQLNQLIGALKITGGSIGKTSFNPIQTAASNSQQTGAQQSAETTGDSFQFNETFGEGLSGAGNFLANNPTLLIVGLGLVALVVLK